MKFKQTIQNHWPKLKSRFPAIAYLAILLVLLGFFFTNDFGLVDIHKTSVVSSVGIDLTESGVKVTAQLAVPMPSENGENVMHTPVEGSGATFADALNEINSQTGFYPKLLFCRLVVLGESCQNVNIFDLLDWFYRDDYSTLTALVAMTRGEASELLSVQTAFSDSTSLTVERILSEELKKSANVSTVNLKILGQQYHSPAASCYMPYIDQLPQETSGGNGGNGGNGGSAQSGNGSSAGGSNQGEQGGSSSGSSQGGGSTANGERTQEKESGGFYCRKTAAFVRGKFVGVLSEDQSLALNLIKNNVKRAILPVSVEGVTSSLAFKNNKGNASIQTRQGSPTLVLSYQAVARIQDQNVSSSPVEQAKGDLVSAEILTAAQQDIIEQLKSLISFCVNYDCDLFGAKTMVYRFANSYYPSLQDNFFAHLPVEYQVQIVSAR
jgi:Ger(x)C family germination protein